MKPLLRGHAVLVLVLAGLVAWLVATETTLGGGLVAGLTAAAILSQLIERRW